MADATKVVSDFRQAMGRGDFASARQLLHEDLSFRGPIGAFDTADAFIEAWKTLPIVVEQVEVRKVFADAADVCVLFDLVAKRPAVTVLVAGVVSGDGRQDRHDAGSFRCSALRRRSRGIYGLRELRPSTSIRRA